MTLAKFLEHAAYVKNSMTLNSLAFYILPTALLFIFLLKDFGIVDLLSNTTGVHKGVILIVIYHLSYGSLFILKSPSWNCNEFTLKYIYVRGILVPLFTIVSYICFPSFFSNSVGKVDTIIKIKWILLILVFYVISDGISFFTRKGCEGEVFLRELRFLLLVFILMSTFSSVVVLTVDFNRRATLSEAARLLVFGILFPIARAFVNRGVTVGINIMIRSGALGGIALINSVNFIPVGVNIFLGSGSLYCIFQSYNNIPQFVLQFSAHSLVNKLFWLLMIPRVQSLFKICKKKEGVLPSDGGKKKIKRESLVVTAVRRASQELVLNEKERQELNESSATTNNALNSKPEEIEKSKETKILTQEIIHPCARCVLVSEQAELMVVKVVLLISFPLVDSLCFNADAPTDSSSIVNWLICVGIAITIDQFLAIIGFTVVQYDGIEIDSNYNLGDQNLLNPLRKVFKGGDKHVASREIIGMSFAIFYVIVMISVGNL